MNSLRSAALAVCLAAPAWPGDILPQPAPEAYRPLTSEERWQLYKKDLFASPLIAFRIGAGVSIAQLRDEPPEWGQGGAGLGRRLAHRYGRLAVQESAEAAGAALLRHDIRYLPRPHAPVSARISHAVTANFVTWDRRGGRVFHASRVGSLVAAEAISRQWMPERYRSASRIARGTAIQLGISTAVNVLREFAPDLKRVFRRR